MIKAHNISKNFRTRHSRVAALKNVSLHIAKGDFVSITGPSGSGKSTLLLTLGGMSAPHEGKIRSKLKGFARKAPPHNSTLTAIARAVPVVM